MDCAVIIPLYNGKRWILETLESVLAQRHVPAEIVVVDDGSDDGSPDLVENFGRGVVLVRQKRGGPPAARNVGLAQTKAPLIAFLDADDLWHPVHLKSLHDTCVSHPDAPAAFSACTRFEDGQKPVLGGRLGQPGKYDPWSGFPLLNRIDCPSMVLIRREALENSGSWEPRFAGVEDFHLWLKLAMRSPFFRIPLVTAARRVHAESVMANWVATDPLRRLRLRQEAAQDAVTIRLQQPGQAQERDRLVRRLEVAGLVCALAECILNRDVDGLTRQALALEEILVGESEAMRRALFVLLMTSLAKRSPSALEHKEFIGTLCEAWPAAAKSTHASLIGFRNERFGPS